MKNMEGDIKIPDKPGSQYIKQALQIIHYEYDGDLSVSKISEKIHISQNYMCRLFNRFMGCSPQAYIVKYRIGVAKELMEKGKPASMAAKEAAKLTGQTKGEVYKRLIENEE